MNPPYGCETSLEENVPGENLSGEIRAGKGFASEGVSDDTRFSATAEAGKTSKVTIKSRYLTVLCINGIVLRGVKG